MKVVLAPDSFKGSLTAVEVCDIAKKALAEVRPRLDVVTVPMADGGEGTLDALIQATNGVKVPVEAMGPLLMPVSAYYGVLGDGVTAVVEMASISGITMVPENLRNPTLTSTYGVGEVLRAALDAGYRKFVIAIGGSATNDGGLGLLQALGAHFWDEAGQAVRPIGQSLASIRNVDLSELDKRIKESSIAVACDVDNPLCGRQGASVVFGPQKGATPEMVQELDKGLAHYAGLVEAALGKSLQNVPGAGAAGGLGFGLLALGAELESGARLIAKAVGLERLLQGADFVITGEGRTDEQTQYGKVPYVVAQLAHGQGVKAILLSGSLDGDLSELETYFVSCRAIVTKPMTVRQAMDDAASLLALAVKRVASMLV